MSNLCASDSKELISLLSSLFFFHAREVSKRITSVESLGQIVGATSQMLTIIEGPTCHSHTVFSLKKMNSLGLMGEGEGADGQRLEVRSKF